MLGELLRGVLTKEQMDEGFYLQDAGYHLLVLRDRRNNLVATFDTTKATIGKIQDAADRWRKKRAGICYTWVGRG